MCLGSESIILFQQNNKMWTSVNNAPKKNLFSQNQVVGNFDVLDCSELDGLYERHSVISGPGSSVDIATGYGLDGPGIESRWGARFFAPVQTGPGARSASYTMGTGSFPGIKSGRGVTLTPYPLFCSGNERVELYRYSPYGPYGQYRASVPVQ